MKIHHWLLPSKKNKYHPPALRPIGLGIFLLLFLAIPLAYNMTTAGSMQVLGYATNISVNSLYALTNQERVNNGLPALALDSQLAAAAQAKANHMISNNYWAHVAPDGTTPWSFINGAGYSYSVAGENLAKNFNTSSGVIAGWMGSATHRANILNNAFADVGFAAVDGVLQGSETTLVVAMYGTRTAPPAPAPVAPAAPAPTTEAPAPSTPAPAETAEPTPAPTEAEPTPQSPVTTTAPIPDTDSAVVGAVEGLSTFLPIQVYNGMNWGQKASLVLLSLLGLLFIMKHTLVWRQQKRGYRHIWLRSHPLSQFAMLAVVAIITILSGVGTVL